MPGTKYAAAAGSKDFRVDFATAVGEGETSGVEDR